MARPQYKKWLEPDGQLLLQAWARDGLTDEQIAKNIGIARGTLYDWKKKYPDISDALKKGKEVVDVEVENALLKKALGYEHEETKTYITKIDGKVKTHKEVTVKHAHPDAAAIIFWLKNRKPEDWRKKTAKEYRVEDLQLEKMAVEIERQKAEIERLKSLLEPATTSERLMVDYIDKLERVLADG